MATKLFLRTTQTNGIGATYFDMVTAAGAGAATAVVGTTTAGTEIQWTQTDGGAELLFVSGRVPAGGFTLTTTDISLWCHESGTGVDAGGAYRIFRRESDGTETELGGGLYSDGVEFTKSTPTEMTWTGNPTDTAFAENDRILLKIKAVEAAAGAMSIGTCTLTYNAADAATGDSFFNIAETVSFKAEEVTVALTGKEATGSAGSFGKTISTALTGKTATGSIGTLVPATSYSVALTGQAATGSAGSFGKTVAAALSGTEATGAASSLGASVSVTLTGKEATGSTGTLTAVAGAVNVAITGVSATGAIGTLTVSTVSGVEEITGAGNTDWLGKRRRGKTLLWSELSRTEEMAMALAEKSIPLAEVTDETDFDDDELLVKALTVTFFNE